MDSSLRKVLDKLIDFVELADEAIEKSIKKARVIDKLQLFNLSIMYKLGL